MKLNFEKEFRFGKDRPSWVSLGFSLRSVALGFSLNSIMFNLDLVFFYVTYQIPVSKRRVAKWEALRAELLEDTTVEE